MSAPQAPQEFLSDHFGPLAGVLTHTHPAGLAVPDAGPVAEMVAAHRAYVRASKVAGPYRLVAVTLGYVQVEEQFFSANFPVYRESVHDDYITRTAYSDGVLFLALFDRAAVNSMTPA